MKFRALVIFLCTVSILSCKDNNNPVTEKPKSTETTQLTKDNDYKIVTELSNISYSAFLYKNSNDYKLEVKDSLSNTIGKFKFNTTRDIKELFSCNYALNEEQKLILLLDSKDSLFDCWSLLKNKVNKFTKTVDCIDYEPEDSYE